MATALAPPIRSNPRKCGVCLDTYQDPRVLPCKHKFCRECIEQCVVSSRDKKTLVCSTCREIVKISKEGVKDLPINMEAKNTTCSNCNTPGNKAKVRCIDCKEYLCDKCHASHKMFKAFRDHKIITMEYILAGRVDPKKEEGNRFCKMHGKVCEYYCETEKRVLCRDCVILNECPAQHCRVSLEKAAQKQADELKVLMKQSDDTQKKFEEAVKATKNVKAGLKIHLQVAKDSIERAKREYIDLVEKRARELSRQVDNIEEEKMKDLDDKQASLDSKLKDFQRAAEDTTKVMKSQSDFEIISAHATLSSQLKKLSKYELEAANKSVGYVKFEAETAEIPTLGKVLKDGLKEGKWKQIGQFSTGDFYKLNGLDLNQAGNSVLCSAEKGVKVFSREGEVVCTLDESGGALDVAITPDHNYVIKPKGKTHITTFDKTGKLVNTTPISNVNDKSSNVNSVAVDPNGRIIVGQVLNTISIHNPDGSVISKFATKSEPYRLAITSNGEIVSSFYGSKLKRGTSVQLLDYSGGNIRVIHPPDEVKVWALSFVCCRQDEIFVSNPGYGDPVGVHRFTSEGEYLGCVTTDVRNPAGIALSKYGTELFVAEFVEDSHVKLFQRP